MRLQERYLVQANLGGYATSNPDGFSDHLTLILDGFGDQLDSILDACPSHLASILDAPISNLAQIFARFDIGASKIDAG